MELESVELKTSIDKPFSYINMQGQLNEKSKGVREMYSNRGTQASEE